MADVRREGLVVASQTDDAAKGHMADMLRELQAILGLDGLEELVSGRLPAALFRHLEAALAAYDRYIDHIVTAEGWVVSCRAGCSACCRHELARGVSVLEAANIYRHVRPWRDIGELYEASAGNAAAFHDQMRTQLRADPRPLENDDARIVDAHLAYNRLRRPCAFLDVAQGVCRIYPVRPLVCRYFFNLSPAEWCDPGNAGYLERTTRCIEPYRAVKECLAAIDARLGVRALSYLSGAFVTLAGEVMEGRPLQEF